MWGLETNVETVICNLRVLYIQTYKNQDKSYQTKQETTNFYTVSWREGHREKISFSREVFVTLQ